MALEAALAAAALPAVFSLVCLLWAVMRLMLVAALLTRRQRRPSHLVAVAAAAAAAAAAALQPACRRLRPSSFTCGLPRRRCSRPQLVARLSRSTST